MPINITMVEQPIMLTETLIPSKTKKLSKRKQMKQLLADVKKQMLKDFPEEVRKYRIVSDYDFYETGAVKNPIPSEDHINPFVGNVEDLWTYYCCGQGHSYMPNRFFSMPSLRNRVLGW